MWQKNHDPPKFQYVQGRRAFTGYSNFSVRFWHAGQKCPDRYWPAGITMQDWHTLQQEQTQTSQRKPQENSRESVASHFALGDDAGKPLRRGGWQSAISEPLRRGGWPSTALYAGGVWLPIPNQIQIMTPLQGSQVAKYNHHHMEPWLPTIHQASM